MTARWVLVLACLGCDATPTPTESTCPDPDPGTLTYDSFGRQFMESYCTHCHNSDLPRSQRNGAPLYHDFDTLIGVIAVAGHIDEWAGAGPAAENTLMPPKRCPTEPGGALDRDCPQPTIEERRQLAEWLVCEKARPHPQ